MGSSSEEPQLEIKNLDLDPDGWFGIKKPPPVPKSGSRKTFAIQQHTKAAGRARVVTLKLEPIDALNRAFSAGQITYDDAVKKAEHIRDLLYKRRDIDIPKKFFSEENKRVLDQYWAAKYPGSRLKKLKDQGESMWHDLRRSIGACGGLSLVVASRDDLQDAVDAHFADNPNLQRRAVTRLNQLLKFQRRDFELDKMPEDFTEVRHLTLEEFNRLHFDNELIEILANIAIKTGLRCGEVFGLDRAAVGHKSYLRVTKQLTGDLKLSKTKNRKERNVYVIEDGWDWIDKWLAIDLERRYEFRNKSHSKMVKSACERVFEKIPVKHCVLHDLRHSYAIFMLGRGVPISHVAMSLGNSISVCEKYYTGYSLSDHAIDAIDRILK